MTLILKSRPQADSYTNGIPCNNQQSFGTPQQAWHAYETQRLANFIQRLPYRPPRAPDSSMPTRTQSAHRSQTSVRIHTASSSGAQMPGHTQSAGRNHNLIPCTPANTVASLHTPNCFSARNDSSRAHHDISTHAVSHGVTPTYSSLRQRVDVGNPPVTPPAMLTASDIVGHSTPSHPPRGSSILSPSSLSFSHSDSRLSSEVSSIFTDSANPSPIGFVYKAGSINTPPRHFSEEFNPYKGEAEAYVVFHGSAPGVYPTW
jgi:hypothetical protein